MEKTVYLIVLEKETPSCEEKISTLWPDDHYISSNKMVAFVSDDTSTLTREIKDKIGIGAEHGAAGFVTKLSATALSGYWDSLFWEWLENAR